MKTRNLSLSLAALAAGALAILSGCSKSGSDNTASTDKTPELYIYNWSDYFAEDTIREFEEQYHCHVIYDVFESNEAMYAKLKAGATNYDVVFPSSYQAKMMHQENMIEDLDKSKLPNLQYIDPEFLKLVALDKTMDYSVPYMTGTTGIAVLKDKVGDYDESWSIYEREDLKGRMTLLNDYREVIGAALRYLGYSLNSNDPEQVRQAGEVVKKWKKNIAKFASDEYKPGMASGEFYVAHGYSGDIMQIEEENENIEYFLPREGFSTWSDDMVILKTAPHKDLAYAFINFLCDAKVAAANMEFNYYLAPNTEAYKLVPQEMRDDPMVFVPEADMERGELIAPLGKDDQIYMDVWNQIKSEE